MNQAVNPLDQLADITLGNPIGWWPLAWGWWVLIGFLCLLVIYGLRSLMRYIHFTKNKRNALKSLAKIEASNPSAIRDAHAIFRHCILHYYSSSDVASLTGQNWYEFLHDRAKSKKLESAEQVCQSISQCEQSLYTLQSKTATDDTVDEQIGAMRVWIQKCYQPSQNERGMNSV